MKDPSGKPSLSPEDARALLRWRLALGAGAEKAAPQLALAELGGAAQEATGVSKAELPDLDRALGFVYEPRAASLAASRPYVPEWLGALRTFFRQDVVALVQRDAIERQGLDELLFEPETLPHLERNAELVATLLSARGLVPDEARSIAREIIAEVVAALRRKLESVVRTAVLGAVRRDRSSPVRSARNLDWSRTIRSNLRGWQAAEKRLIPERFHFFANQRRRHEWDVVLAVDQSGSMAQSVVYSSIMAAIFASLDVLRTRMILFDTELVDVTSLLGDPVELLLSAQLGGGTDIHRAVAHVADHLIERPERTIFILISDLFEGGDRDALLARMRALAESRVKALVLLALSDRGRPAYDHDLARELEGLGVRCFGATPSLLVEVMARLLAGQDLGELAARSGAGG